MIRPHMRKVKAKNTAPEIKLRKLLWKWGYRGYRLHRTDLPGKPDIAFISSRKVIFMHGCFWHGHHCRAGQNVPRSNLEYWEPKLRRNREKDKRNIQQLKKMGWNVLVIWECQLKQEKRLQSRIYKFLCV